MKETGAMCCAENELIVKRHSRRTKDYASDANVYDRLSRFEKWASSQEKKPCSL